MEKILVIGSNSFSGADFVDYLLGETDCAVIGVSRSPQKTSLFLPYLENPGLSRFRFYQMDLNHDLPALLELIEREKPSRIVNFAAQSEVAPSWDNPGQWFITNAASLADLCIKLVNRPWLKTYLHISSPEVYGTCEGVVKEDGLLNPSTPYAASKAAGDMMLFTLVKNFDFPLVMIRSTNVYGARQQLFKIIPRTAIYLKLGKKIELHGGGHAVKSYIHIRDISRGEYAAMLNGQPGEIYHLSPDAGVAVKDLVETICRLTGHPFEESVLQVAERLGQDKAYVIDSSKARRAFNWEPKISLEEGLVGVAQWVDRYWDEIQQQPMNYVHKP